MEAADNLLIAATGANGGIWGENDRRSGRDVNAASDGLQQCLANTKKAVSCTFE